MKEIIDCHTHCDFSHDSRSPARDMIEGALAKGLSYFAITDHCDKDCEVSKDVTLAGSPKLPLVLPKGSKV